MAKAEQEARFMDDMEEANAFYRDRPDMAAFVDSAGEAHVDEYLELDPDFYRKLKLEFPGPAYDDEGRELPGELGILQGFRLVFTEGMPVPWRWVKEVS